MCTRIDAPDILFLRVGSHGEEVAGKHIDYSRMRAKAFKLFLLCSIPWEIKNPL